MRGSTWRILPLVVLCCIAIEVPRAQSLPPSLFGDMRWRMIGPFRGGRTKAAAGIPAQPNVFYVGAVNGGVWKTTDYGRTWVPIFDDQPTGSIGAIAVAPSNPNIIYVGSGEGLQRPDLSTGDGIYESTDAGKTWTHLGLRDGQQIPQIIVDPKNADRLFVAVLGHPYGPNEERGIFRSTDGAKTFQKVLYKDENTGGVDVAFDPSNADHIYAALWEARQGPWENGAFTGPNSGLFESTDGGTTWQRLTKGLPTFEQGLSRIGITIAPSNPRRMFAAVASGPETSGLYRSDDAGQSWYRVTDDQRVVTRGDDFAEVKVHPTNPDIVYTASIVSWKSTDGGKTFTAFRGAPGGDDYHRIWINPDNPDIMLIASDQGAIVTVNGGQTFSSWYNQPTAQFYHVSTDNAFPYRVCSGQQESGSACVSSRGSYGQITFREWTPVGAEEYGYVAADPLNPDIVYGGKLSRFDRRTGQVQDISPVVGRPAGYRVVRTQPVLFSPIDPHLLYFTSNVVWKTLTGGRSWTQISPDLTRETWEVPPNVGKYIGTVPARPTRRGVVYTLAPSPLDINRLWAGTDDGLIHVTTNGGTTWTNVTPRELGPWAKVSLMDASHFDPLEAYAAINTIRLDDLRPHIYRTRDGGKTWQHITNGLPEGATVNAVREDAVRKGLLFAGTERQVYFSVDDGDTWQSLRLNMPATSIRDLVVKGDDLVVGTHGRGFWILDDITPLRQIDAGTANTDVVLFKPQQAWRVRWNLNTDTPLPREEPAGQNPPDGAIIDYYLRSSTSAPITLEVLSASGAIVRTYSSDDPVEPLRDEGNVPAYWIRPSFVLSRDAGMHRFVWDLHHSRPRGLQATFPIAAVYRNTAREPNGVWAQPGTYRVRLTVDGRAYTHPLIVRMDPRVKTSAVGLAQQFTLSKQLSDAIETSTKIVDEIRLARERIAKSGQANTNLDDKLATLGGLRVSSAEQAGFLQSISALTAPYVLIQDADVAPTAQAVRAAEQALSSFNLLVARWNSMKPRLR